MAEHCGEGAHDALGDEGASGLHDARKLVMERIVAIDPDDPEAASKLATSRGALDALELVLDAIGKLEPRRH